MFSRDWRIAFAIAADIALILAALVLAGGLALARALPSSFAGLPGLALFRRLVDALGARRLAGCLAAVLLARLTALLAASLLARLRAGLATLQIAVLLRTATRLALGRWR